MIATQTSWKQTATLADAALPRRSKQALEHVLADVRPLLEQHLSHALQNTEYLLARAAPHAEPAQQAARLEAIRHLGGGTGIFIHRFLSAVETSLATLSAARTRQRARPVEALDAHTELTLLDDEALTESTLLDGIATRLESRNSLALQLLGHRLGVLAAAPAFEGETLPLGPHALCQALSEAASALTLTPEARMLLFQQFEKALSESYPALLDTVNARLVHDGILPFLTFIPVRIRPGSAAPAASAATGSGQAAASPGSASPLPPADATQAFGALQGLLQRRRQRLNRLRPGNGSHQRTTATTTDTLDTAEVLAILQRLRSQQIQAADLATDRQNLLAHARQLHGRGVALTDANQDRLELLELYFNQLRRELRPHSVGETLVNRLRLPLEQLVLRDLRFFLHPGHPARQLLNAVSMAGARWLAEDDLDHQWLGLLQRAVATVQQDHEGRLETFVEAQQTLHSGLQAQARRTDLAERRQIEAAQGRDKLILARQYATDTIARLLHGRSLPRFQTLLLEQAWVDVLALVYLRSGTETEAWRTMLELSARLIDHITGDAPLPVIEDVLADLCNALQQVGYHHDDAVAIAHYLLDTADTDTISTSRTELLMQLRARARLGEGSDDDAATPPPPLTTHELDARERLRALPCPVWIELLAPNDDPLRRRLAWVSPQTSQALLLNRRAQRIGTEDLDVLARMLAAGHLRVLQGDPSPAETAWDALLAQLQHLGSEDSASDVQEAPHGR